MTIPVTLNSQLITRNSMLSVAIIARDEERHIGDAIRSVAGLAAEVVVLLDQRTCDRTAEVARGLGARVVVEPWRGFSAQRNRALALCSAGWVLFLDADERVSEELAGELLQVTGYRVQGIAEVDRGTTSVPCSLSPVTYAGYWIPRQNLFFGKIARGGGWYPDHQLRLLRPDHARYDESRLVHEFAELDGQAGELRGHLLHLNVEQAGELWRKQRAYAIQEAQTLYLAGQRARWRNFIGAPLREFYRRYLQLGGYRDGALGLLLCGTLAFFELIKFAHLKGLERV